MNRAPRTAAVVVGIVVTAIVGLAIAHLCTHLAHRHGDWGRGVADLLVTISWMPSMWLGFMAYARVDDWLSRRARPPH